MEKILNNKWLKIGLFSALGLLLAGGLVWAGYWWWINSNLKTQKSKLQVKTQNLTPTLMPLVTSLPTFSLEPTLLPDETAGWKTYTNTKYGYSVKYPSDWEMNEEKDFYPPVISWTKFSKVDETQEKVILPGDTHEKAHYTIAFRVIDNPKNYSAKEYFNEFGVEAGLRPKEIIVVAGEEGIRYDPGFWCTDVIIAHAGKIHELLYSPLAQKGMEEKFIAIFNLMLSTFKFLD